MSELLQSHVTPDKKFRFGEFVVSKGHPELIKDYVPTYEVVSSIRMGTQMILDPWRRRHPDNALIITSAVRPPALNEIIGGTKDSDHLSFHFCAVDAYARGMDAGDLFCSLVGCTHYRQLIYYPNRSIVHVSWNIPGRSFKHEAMITRDKRTDQG